MRRKFKIEASSYNNNPTSQILKKGAIEYNGYYIVEDPAGDGYNVFDENFSLVDEGYGSLGSAKECIEQLVENDPERIHCATEEDEQVMYQADMANGIQDAKQEVVGSPNLVSNRRIEDIQTELSFALDEVMMGSEFGFSKDEVEECCGVGVEEVENSTKFTVWAEVGHEGMEKIAEALNPIIEKYQEGAYFDFECLGQMSAYVDMLGDGAIANSSEVSSSSNIIQGYWYFTRHGVQPGSIPRRASVLDMIDTPNGTYVKLDCVLNTEELNEYDMKEQAPSSDIMSANILNYGGAFDIEPEQYFTREEINEVGEEVCERLKPLFNSEFKVTDLYMDDKGDNNLTMEIESLATGEVFFTNLQIDRRWGKSPRAMLLKAVKLLVDKFENAINQTSFELSSGVEASTDIQHVENVSASGYSPQGYSFNPPRKFEYELDDQEETIETSLDAIILMDEDGSWTYEDESYPWAADEDGRDGDWYSEQFPDIKLIDKISLVETVDEFIEPLIPSDPGRYHITGDIELVFTISGVEATHTAYGWSEEEGEIGDIEHYTGSAEVELDEKKSSLDNFQWKMIGPEEKVNVESSDNLDGLSFSNWAVAEGPKPTPASGYDNWTLLEKSGSGVTPRYSMYDNSIDSLDQASAYTFQLSKLSPYDNTEYVWCKYQGGVANYYRVGKRCFSESFTCDESKYEEVSEWQNEVIERCLARLESFNSKLKSNIDHS